VVGAEEPELGADVEITAIDGDELVSTASGGALEAVDAEPLGSGRKGISE
jgi:hypothetical protein